MRQQKRESLFWQQVQNYRHRKASMGFLWSCESCFLNFFFFHVRSNFLNKDHSSFFSFFTFITKESFSSERKITSFFPPFFFLLRQKSVKKKTQQLRDRKKMKQKEAKFVFSLFGQQKKTIYMKTFFPKHSSVSFGRFFWISGQEKTFYKCDESLKISLLETDIYTEIWCFFKEKSSLRQNHIKGSRIEKAALNQLCKLGGYGSDFWHNER